MDFSFVLKQYESRPNVEDEFDFNENFIIGKGSYGHVYKVQKKSIDDDNKYYALKELNMSTHLHSTCRELAVSYTYVSFIPKYN